MKKRTLAIICVILTITLIAGVSVVAATNYGTQSDPLVTLSYLTGTLTPKLLLEMQSELIGVAQSLEASFDAKLAEADMSSYTLVTLSRGETLKGSEGCEVMLRFGSASAVVNTGEIALIDMTEGVTVNSGTALVLNHLYMISSDGCGVTAGAAVVKLLVRGGYTVE